MMMVVKMMMKMLVMMNDDNGDYDDATFAILCYRSTWCQATVYLSIDLLPGYSAQSQHKLLFAARMRFTPFLHHMISIIIPTNKVKMCVSVTIFCNSAFIPHIVLKASIFCNSASIFCNSACHNASERQHIVSSPSMT